MAVEVRLGLVGSGPVRFGGFWRGGLGAVRFGAVCFGAVWRGWAVKVGYGSVRLGLSRRLR